LTRRRRPAFHPGIAPEVHVRFTLTQGNAQLILGAMPTRAYAMTPTPDPTTLVDILAVKGAGPIGPNNPGVLIKELTAKNPYAEVTDSSVYVGYTVKQGLAPSEVWLDAPDVPAPDATVPVWLVVRPAVSSYTANPGELVLVDAAIGGGGVTITLPTAAGITGQRVGIKDTGGAFSHHITVATASGQTVDNAAPQPITTNLASRTYVSDGANWWIVG
jgi:hypothetical protein